MLDTPCVRTGNENSYIPVVSWMTVRCTAIDIRSNRDGRDASQLALGIHVCRDRNVRGVEVVAEAEGSVRITFRKVVSWDRRLTLDI